MDSKFCPACRETKEVIKFYRNSDGSIRKHVCMACYGKRDRAKLKLDALKAFGYKCQCCNESHPYFLTLDHVKNDGAQHRENYNEQQIYREARREGWPPEKYQLLCMNCNFAKGHFNECPHRLQISAYDALTNLQSLCFSFGWEYRKANTSNLPEARKAGTLKRFEQKLKNLNQEDLDKLLEIVKSKS